MGNFDATTILIYAAAILGTVAILILYWVQVAGKRVFASATNCFMAWQLVLLAGTILAVDLTRSDDQLWLFVIVGGLLCFTIGAIVANNGSGFRPAQEIDRFTKAALQFDLDSNVYYFLVLGMALICAAVGVAFSLIVGYNVFFWAFGQALTNGSVDRVTYSTLRLAIGTEGYVAVGYTVQFTSILLPLILYLMYFRVRQTRHFWEMALAAILLVADLYFLTIKGGRVWFVYAGLCFFLLVSPFGPIVSMWRTVRRSAAVTLLALVSMYVLTTTFTGHAGTSTGSPLGLLTSLSNDVFQRLAGWQAGGQLLVMRFLIAQPIAWGGEWGGQLLSILPSANKAFGFNTNLYAFLYNGNDHGGFGLTIWGSLLYNWGAPGALFLSFLMGFLIQRFSIMQVRTKRLTSHVVVLFVAGFYLGTISDIYQLFLNGFVTVLIYFALIRLVENPRLPILRALLPHHVARAPAVADGLAIAPGVRSVPAISHDARNR